MDTIIVNYQSSEYIFKAVQSIHVSVLDKGGHIFVQNNSKEDDLGYIEKLFPQVITTCNEKNIGFAAAVNQGLRQSSSPYVMLLNPDAYISNGLISSISDYLDRNPDIGVVGPKILNVDGSTQGSARSFPNALTALYGRSSLLTRLFPGNSISRKNVKTIDNNGNSSMEVNWVSGACMVVRRDTINDVGLMDERFFMYWEDADWCRRMWENGWKVAYYPKAVVYHHGCGSSAKHPFRAVYHHHLSSYRLFVKYSRPLFHLFRPIVLTVLFCRGLLSLPFNVLLKKIFDTRSLQSIRKSEND